MLKQYDILTKCLIMLNIPLLPQIEKLKLEIQLILLKQLLLMTPIEKRITGLARSEAQFEELYHQIDEVCKATSMFNASQGLRVLTTKVRALTEELKKYLDQDGKEQFALEPTQLEKPNLWN